MSKTNSTQQPPAPQSVPVSNDAPSSSSSAKPTFNYAAAAARSSGTSKPGPPNTPAAPAAPAAPAPLCPPSFASAVVATSSPLASNSTSAKPSSNRTVPDAIPTSRPSNGTSSAVKSPVPTLDRKASLVPAKSHNIKPSSSHISFGSLADIPAKADDSSVLSSSPANPPTLLQRDGPPVFGSVPADLDKKPAKSSSLVNSTSSKPSGPPPPTTGPSTKPQKKKIDFQAFFMAGGESVSNPPPPPASSGSSPSPSISYRGDPTQHRRNPNNLDSHPTAPGAPASPRPSHVGVPNGPSAGSSFHSPLSGASRAFTPAQGPSPMSQQPQHHHQYGMGAAGGHWQNGPAPNSPHFVPGNPPINANMPNYPVPNGTMGSNHGGNPSQYLPKPPPFSHRNGLGSQSAGSSSTIYPPSSGRSNLHHQSRNSAAGPPSPRLPSGNAPNGGQSPNYQHSSNGQGMPAPYWPQGPSYPQNGPGPYPPYGYNPNNMPTYPHPTNFPPPQHGQHHSPQLSHQTVPSVLPPPAPVPASTSAALPNSSRTHPTPPPPLPIPSSPVPSNNTYAPPYPPALYSPGSSHSRGPSLSYNAPSFNPSAPPDFKPHTPNAAAPAFMPRRSAAVPIKKPVTPISETPEKHDEVPSSTQSSKDRRVSTSKGTATQAKPSDSAAQKKGKPTEEAAKITVTGPTETNEKAETSAEAQQTADAKKVAEDAAEKKRLEETKAAEEAAAKARAAQAKAEEDARLDRQKKEQAEKEAKEKAEKEAKVQAEQEAKAKAEQEAKAKAEQEQREKEERERQAKKDQETKELAEKQAKQTKPPAEVKSVEPQVKLPSSASPAQPASKPLESKSNDAPVQQPEPATASTLPSKPVNGAPLPPSGAKVRPAPIDVNAAPQSKLPGESVTPSLPSALSSARKIEDLGKVSYPDNIKSPRSELNADATPGKFRYDRAFLLQFMEVCKGKPVQLPDLDSIGMVDAHNAGMNPMSRTQSTGGQRRNAGQMPPSRGPSGSLTPSGGNMSTMAPAGLVNRAGPGAGMPMFNTGASRSSEERFNQSNRASMGAMPIGMGLMLPGRPTGQMSRSPSTNALPGIMSNGARDTTRRSGRGSRRDGAPSHPPSNVNPNLNRGMSMQPMFPVEVVQPLQPSANSWAAARTTQLEEDSPELVNRKVKALLNKLTLDKFESISDQVIAWANKSEKEHDGRILRQVIALIFEKATDEAHWSEMYAKLCRKLMEKLSPAVKDESLSDPAGNKVQGGHLFRKYLLNRCQEDYERGWSKRDELAAAAAGKAADDAVKQAANEKSRAEAEAEGKEAPAREAEILSDEYYAAQKAKRQGLGLVRFIGELFKLNMLTERIMHECIKKLLSNIETPEEEDIESLSRLMMTVGALLDHEKAISHMNVYFSRMQIMSNSPNLSSRARFMLQDVIDTRNNKWVGRNVAAGPKLISQIHEEAAQAAAEQSRQAQQASKKQMHDLSRGGSRGGRNREQPGGDGWSAVGGTSAPPPRPSKAGDLTQFGKLRDTSSSARSTFGPSVVFANKGKLKDAKLTADREPAVAVAPNPFAALGGDTTETSGPGLTRKPSAAELAPTGGRPRLNLAPRTLPLPGQSADGEGTEKKETTAGDGAGSTEEDGKMDEETRRCVKASVDEFFHVRSITEGVEAFKALPKQHYHELIRSLVEKVLEKKAADVDLTASLFKKLAAEDHAPQPVFLKAFAPVLEQLDDIAVDARYAYEFCGKLLKASGLSEANVKQLAQKIETEELATASQRLVDCFNAAKLD